MSEVTEFTCEWCSAVFERPAKARGPRPRFCPEHRQPDNRKPLLGPLSCPQCGKTFVTTDSRKVYCDKLCAAEAWRVRNADAVRETAREGARRRREDARGGRAPRVLKRDQPCQQDGCGEIVGFKGAKGLCERHYAELLRQRRRDWSEPCSVDGCSRSQLHRGLCKPHLRRFKEGDISRPVRAWNGAPRVCQAPGCDAFRVKSASYCPVHARTLWAYGLTPEAYDALLEAQGGCCAICGSPDPRNGAQLRWAVDHDHACCPGSKTCGKCVRGLLCHPCNHGLGKFGDNASVLRAAAAYLDRYALA